jgi:hypothetical protein
LATQLLRPSDYRPGELLVIKDGTSPDKRFSIVAGDPDKQGGFGVVYLMEARTKKVIGELKDVATNLDTAPDAYRAHWSPDSKHVGITSRAERHWAANVTYRIENRRAYSVETPELLCHAVPDFCALTKNSVARIPRAELLRISLGRCGRIRAVPKS